MAIDDDLKGLAKEATAALRGGSDARVVGERVRVLAVEVEGNERRGLVAKVERRGNTYVVSLADVRAERGAPLERVIERYRTFLGIDRARGDRVDTSGRASGASFGRGDLIEVGVLSVKKTAARCRLLEGGTTFTLRQAGSWDAVPGEIARIRVEKTWSHAGRPYASGEAEGVQLDVARLGLVPLRLEPQGDWDPAEEYWGDDGPAPEWAAAIIADGKRPAFEMEQVIPGADPEDWESDPIGDAAELHQTGDDEGARALLMEQLDGDLRCLDAHAHLGNLVFEASPQVALRHYAVGVQVGELSVGPGFDGLLPWGFVDNRPFLRCLHGSGLCLWRLGRLDAARAVFERMLRLNPSDNQGARFLREDLRRGRSWEERNAQDERDQRALSEACEDGPRRLQLVPPPPREVPVDLEELELAIEDGDPEHAWYLDTESGELHRVSDLGDDEDLPVPRDVLEADERYALVAPDDPGIAYRDMVEFVPTVRSAALRTRLADALDGKGAFGRFRRVLADDPPARERWFAFRKARLQERARAWLATIGIVASGRRA